MNQKELEEKIIENYQGQEKIMIDDPIPLTLL